MKKTKYRYSVSLSYDDRLTKVRSYADVIIVLDAPINTRGDIAAIKKHVDAVEGSVSITNILPLGEADDD